MSDIHYRSHLQTAISLVQQYDGALPLHHYLKQYFALHKKHGSTDRKQITRLCYSFFRTGHSLDGWDAGQKMMAALFLCTHQPDKMLQALHPGWNEYAETDLSFKCQLLGIEENGLKLFSWPEELSEGMDAVAFNHSHLVQPDLFLRIRPGHHDGVMNKLKQSPWPYEFIPPCSIRLPNHSNAAALFEVDKEVVVQDLSSQAIGSFIGDLKNAKQKLSVWDCCAASGGKSLLAKDILGNIELTVSDIRKSILQNLANRFSVGGMKEYRSVVVDLTAPNATLSIGQPDLIMADVPCTGSGTWGRNPERLYFFDKKEIEQYSLRQRSILSNLVPHLKPGAILLYSTCSVFRKENEEIAEFVTSKLSLKLKKMELLKGYPQKADTLFAATFTA